MEDEIARLRGQVHAHGIALRILFAAAAPTLEQQTSVSVRLLDGIERSFNEKRLTPTDEVVKHAALSEVERLFKHPAPHADRRRQDTP